LPNHGTPQSNTTDIILDINHTSFIHHTLLRPKENDEWASQHLNDKLIKQIINEFMMINEINLKNWMDRPKRKKDVTYLQIIMLIQIIDNWYNVLFDLFTVFYQLDNLLIFLFKYISKKMYTFWIWSYLKILIWSNK
jgi:hypothetical protein